MDDLVAGGSTVLDGHPDGVEDQLGAQVVGYRPVHEPGQSPRRRIGCRSRPQQDPEPARVLPEGWDVIVGLGHASVGPYADQGWAATVSFAMSGA
ncbi:hypothetical protein V1634_26660 [Plantactinospora veratri]|uniref:Uncharacterized protein n=1 Tax=Plantactinospora veratri TaxID=1436122 RepID=A0ABU7SLL7_9ACTN